MTEVAGSPGTNGAAPAASEASGATAELHAAVAALELRLRTIEERPAVASVPPERRGSSDQGEEGENEEVVDLASRVAELSARLDELTPVEETVADLGRSVEGLVTLRANDALATGARLARVEAAVAETASADGQLPRDLPGAEERLADLFDQIASIRERVALHAEQVDAAFAGAREESEQALASILRETSSVAARTDELLALRHADAQASRAAIDEIAGQVATLSTLDEPCSQTQDFGSELRAELHDVVSRLESRLEGQAVLAEVRARAMEDVVRTSLDGLRELPDAPNESSGKPKKHRKQEKKGKRERRAAGDQAVAFEGAGVQVLAGGWLAFAPTVGGFRLIELEGVVPEVGATLELPEVEGHLVVTRVGCSPLLFDSRSCAFLDRA